MKFEIFIGVILFYFIVYLIIRLMLKRDRRYSDKEKIDPIYYSLIITFLAALPTYLNLNQENEEEKKNYITLLKTDIKMDEHYTNMTQNILQNINSKSEDSLYIDHSINNIKEQLVLKEVIKNGYIYKYSSPNFQNYVAKLISLMQEDDLTISRVNAEAFKKLLQNLVLKQKLLDLEIKFAENRITEDQINKEYETTLLIYQVPLKNIESYNKQKNLMFIDTMKDINVLIPNSTDYREWSEDTTGNIKAFDK